jgi:hypothetical protein
VERAVDVIEMEMLLRNLDRRMSRVEQILPTLATKAELAAAIAPLATKAELAAAIAPLATKAEVKDEGERSRRHMEVVAESLRDDIRLVAEAVVGLGQRIDRLGGGRL